MASPALVANGSRLAAGTKSTSVSFASLLLVSEVFFEKPVSAPRA